MGLNDDVIRKAIRGDLDAFQEIYNEFSKPLYNLVLKMMKHPQEAEDIVQDIFVHLFRKLRQYRFESAFSTWIYRVSVNHCLNVIKQRNRRTEKSRELASESVVMSIVDLDEKLDWSVSKEVVTKTLYELPDHYRMVLLLRYYQEFSYDEIASILGKNLNTIKTWIRRAHQQFEERFKEVEPNENRVVTAS